MEPSSEPADLLARVLAAGPALEPGAWALDQEGLAVLVAEIAAGRRRVIECGSGDSTVVIARALRLRGEGSVESLEHEPERAAALRARLADEGLERLARVLDAPLRTTRFADCGEWYDPAVVERLDDDAELLLVDGPPASPGGGAELARLPALAALRPKLAPGCRVILDDADRAGEREVLRRWGESFGIDFDLTAGRAVIGTL